MSSYHTAEVSGLTDVLFLNKVSNESPSYEPQLLDLESFPPPEKIKHKEKRVKYRITHMFLSSIDY